MSGLGIIDKDTGALVCIDYEHHRIHAGKHFLISGFDVFASDASIYFGVRTPADNVAHFTFEVNATSQTEFYIYEGATFTNGAAVIPVNNNRNSVITSDMVVKINPTVAGGATGTTIYSQSRGLKGVTPAKGPAFGVNSREREFELKESIDYIIQIKSKDDDNIISYEGEWYELAE